MKRKALSATGSKNGEKGQGIWMIGHIEQGIWMFGRFSVGWNFHPNRNITTIALPLAISFSNDDEGGERCLVILGPITFVYLM
jgi:hypothetical protein